MFGSEEYPYLQSRECPEDVEAKEEMTVSMIQGSDMEVTGTDNAGYVTEVRCGSETVNGDSGEPIILPRHALRFRIMTGRQGLRQRESGTVLG